MWYGHRPGWKIACASKNFVLALEILTAYYGIQQCCFIIQFKEFCLYQEEVILYMHYLKGVNIRIDYRE
jgi:hypothetical protein